MSRASEAGAALYARYLRVLGVPARPPGLEALAELVSAQVTRVPFENLSKLRFRNEPAMRLPPLTRWLDGIEHFGLGGTCYANNLHLHGLLAHLGYDARICGADMSRPDVHVASIVTLEGREYLVDAGYGAPLHAPLPLDLPYDQAITLGEETWVLRPRTPDGRSRLDLLRSGSVRHGYTLNPRLREAAEFTPVIEDSFSPGATFMNALVIARFAPGRSRVLHNLVLTESESLASVHCTVAASVSELLRAIEEHLGIPAGFAREALAGIEPVRDAWS